MTDVLIASDVEQRPLLRYLLRLCRWPALVTGVALAWALTWWRIGDVTNELAGVWLLRIVVVIGCVTGAFALDDPSRNVTEPAARTRRRLVPARLMVAVAVVLAAALPAAAVVGDQISANVAGGLILETVAVTAVVCAVALTLQRPWRIFEPAQYVVLCVPLLAAVDPLTAGHWALLVGPGPGWGAAHARWGVVAGVALAVCAWQLRDPASRLRIRPGRRAQRASVVGAGSRSATHST